MGRQIPGLRSIVVIALLILGQSYVFAEECITTSWYRVVGSEIVGPFKPGCNSQSCVTKTIAAYVEGKQFGTDWVYCDSNENKAKCVNGPWIYIGNGKIYGEFNGCNKIADTQEWCPTQAIDVLVRDSDSNPLYGTAWKTCSVSDTSACPAGQGSVSLPKTSSAAEVLSASTFGSSSGKQTASVEGISLTNKCVAVSALDGDGQCPAGKLVTVVQQCLIAPTATKSFVGSASVAGETNPCPSGQTLQAVKKCVALTDLTTSPDASGNCAKDQLPFIENGIKKCAPAAAMKDAALPKAAEQPADQSASGGGGGCSLIR